MTFPSRYTHPKGVVFKANDIYPISDFIRNTRSHIERLRETRQPEVLTVNGEAELIIQNAVAYQEMLDHLDELETIIALDEAHEEMERGEGSDADEALARLRKCLGVDTRDR